jgi:hypothetical protein
MSQCGSLLSCNLNKWQGSEERPVNSMPGRVSATAHRPWLVGDYAHPPIVQADERQRRARALSVADRLAWARALRTGPGCRDRPQASRIPAVKAMAALWLASHNQTEGRSPGPDLPGNVG